MNKNTNRHMPKKDQIGRTSNKNRSSSGIHQHGYRPSGSNTSSGCTPPNTGTGVNKHK